MNYDTLDNAATMDGGDHEGKLLAQRYRIIRKLGEGGMGMVYLAADTELGDHPVAIKFIPPMLAGNTRAVKSLKREALTSRQLSHPNIVRLHDLHTDGHQKFLVMEFIEGRTLDDVLGDTESESLPLERVLDIIEQLAAGLDYAHSQQVLHRDLKPSNIMIGDDGSVKLLDFGIAREMKDSYTRVTGNLTSGTLPYMSPEQLLGENPTVAMDVYSLGAVTYECLAGHPPFHMGDIRRQIEVKEPEPIASMPAHVNRVLLQVLDKQSAHRPPSAGALAQALREPNVTPKPVAVPDPKTKREDTPVSQPVAATQRKEEASLPEAIPTLSKRPSPPAVPVPSEEIKPISVETLRTPVGFVLLAILLSMIVWGAGYAAEMILYDTFANEEGELATGQNLLLAEFWALWCGLGTACVLLLLRLFKNWKAVLALPIAWAVLWAPAYMASYTVSEDALTRWGLIALGQILGSGALLVILRQEGLRLSWFRNLLLVMGWLGIGLLHRRLWDGLLASDLWIYRLEEAVGQPWTAIAGIAGLMAGGLYAIWVFIVARVKPGKAAKTIKAKSAPPKNGFTFKMAMAVTVTLLVLLGSGSAILVLKNRQAVPSEQASCESDLRNIVTAWNMYRLEKGQVPETLAALGSYLSDSDSLSGYVYRAADLYAGTLNEPGLILAYDIQAKHPSADIHIAFVDGRVETCESEIQLQNRIERDNEIRAMHKVHDKPIWE